MSKFQFDRSFCLQDVFNVIYMILVGFPTLPQVHYLVKNVQISCEQVPVIMWDPHGSFTSLPGDRHAGALHSVAHLQLLQPGRFFLQEEGVFRATCHWVSLHTFPWFI